MTGYIHREVKMKVEDNQSPYLTHTEQGSTPTNPAAGDQKTFIRTSDHHLCRVNSAGAVTDIEGAGGGVTFEVAGYNTIGASTENLTVNRVIAKQVTLANNAALYSIDAYLNQDSDNVHGLGVAVYSDVAGDPGRVIAVAPQSVNGYFFHLTAAPAGDYAARWVSFPIGCYLAAGNYWIAIMNTSAGGNLILAYDGSGADRYYGAGGLWFTDWGYYSPTTSGNKYSIRAQLLR
jgi:hypothetical protein